jgi:hypothetical protein
MEDQGRSIPADSIGSLQMEEERVGSLLEGVLLQNTSVSIFSRSEDPVPDVLTRSSNCITIHGLAPNVLVMGDC